MATSHDFDGSLQFVAVSAVTAGTLVVTATTLVACFALTSATSGNTYAGKISGRVNGVTKLSTSAAFLTGTPLTITATNLAAIATVGGIVNAYVAAGAASTDVTCDVILVNPIIT